MKFFCLLCLSIAAAFAQTIDIGVFSLFRPKELVVRPASTALLVNAGDSHMTLRGRETYRIRTAARVSARDGSATDFVLSVPGKIERRFHGILTVSEASHQLTAVVSMDLEAAVASVVAAEMIPGTPLEALKAQAVAARSFYTASAPRHEGYTFCDTTHCQFLRERPSPASAPARAAAETSGLVLKFAGKPFVALYSAACGGRTRDLDAVEGYPYHAVDCQYCRRNSPGLVRGHQLGLCQTGAAGMAAKGANFRTILGHYYPAASLAPIVTRTFSTFLLRPSPPLRHSKD